jgi:hypothetical protein
VQESGSFQTTQKVPKKSDFWEKSDFSNRAQGAHQEIRFLRKIGFLKPCPSAHQEIRFLRKIGFLKPCPRCPSRNPIFEKNRISQTVPKVPKKFLGKIGFLLNESGLEISAFVY